MAQSTNLTGCFEVTEILCSIGYSDSKIPGFPDLSKHNNWMAKCLTHDIYMKLKDKKTSSGFTLDQMIQTGVDNPGHPFIYTVGMSVVIWTMVRSSHIASETAKILNLLNYIFNYIFQQFYTWGMIFSEKWLQLQLYCCRKGLEVYIYFSSGLWECRFD